MPKKTTRITRPTLMTTWHRKRPQTRQSFAWNVGMNWSREALNKVGQKQILKDKRKNPRVGSPKPMFYILYYQLGVCHPKWLFQGWSFNQPEIADLDVTSGLSAAPVGPRWDFFSMTRWPWVTTSKNDWDLKIGWFQQEVFCFRIFWWEKGAIEMTSYQIAADEIGKS